MFPATSNNGSQRLIQSGDARCLTGPLSVSHLNKRRHNQLRFTAAASCDRRAWLISPMPDTGAKLPGNNRSDDASARLFQDGVSKFIKRARFCTVFAATVASEERDKARLNNPQRMTIPARAPGRAGGHCRYRIGNWLPGGAGAEFCQMRYRDCVAVGFRNRLQRIVQCLPRKQSYFPRVVV